MQGHRFCAGMASISCLGFLRPGVEMALLPCATGLTGSACAFQCGSGPHRLAARLRRTVRSSMSAPALRLRGAWLAVPAWLPQSLLPPEKSSEAGGAAAMRRRQRGIDVAAAAQRVAARLLLLLPWATL